MIGTLYSIIVVVIGLGLYLLRPKWIIIYWLILFPVVFPLYNLITLNFDREVFYKMINQGHDGFRNLFLILFIIEWTKNKCRISYMGMLFISIIGIVIYIFFHNLIHHPEQFELWSVFSQLFSLILPLLFYIHRRDLLPNIVMLHRIIIIILILQILGMAVDLTDNHIYPTFYIPYTAVLENGSMYNDTVYEGLIMGTFPSSTILANFLTTIYLFYSLEYFSGKNVPSKMYWCLTIIIGIMLLLSGIRVGLVLFVFILIACNVMYIHRHVKLFVFTTVVAISGYLFLMSYDVSAGSNDGNEGVDRQIDGMAMFVQSKESGDEDFSTFRLTPYLLDNYFLEGPFFGNGLSYKGEFAYGNSGSVTLEMFQADARLAYMIVEYGLIGILLYFLYYTSIFNYLKTQVVKEERKKLSLCFLYFILLTFVDPGLFDRLNFPLVYIYGLCVLQPLGKNTNLMKFVNP